MDPTRRPSQTPVPAAAPDPQALMEEVAALARELNPSKPPAVLRPDSSLERDAGLDSLGRMELLRRLERRFGLRLDERQVLAAEAVGDLIQAVQGSPAGAPTAAPQPAAAPGEEVAVPLRAGTLVEALRWYAEASPERVHVRYFADQPGDETVLTYGELWQRAGAVAAALRQRGVGAGSAVALMLPTGGEFFAVFFGALLAGAVPVPIYPPVRRAQLGEYLARQAGILDNAAAAVLVTAAEAQPVARFLLSRVASLQAVATPEELQQGAAGDVVAGAPDDLALLQYTSGSTGSPKGVELTHANLLANIRAMGRALEVGDADRFVSWLPLYHDMGLIGAWLGSLYFGLPLVLMSPLAFIARPERWLQAIHRHGGTLSAAPNFAYDLCVDKIEDDRIEGLDLSSLRFCCNGAEPVSARTLRRFNERFAAFGLRPDAVNPVYGLAECSVGLTFPPLARTARLLPVQERPFRERNAIEDAPPDESDSLEMVGCGYPLPGHEVRIADATDREIGERRVGRVQFRGPSATAGYHRNPEATAALRHGDWLDSGDYGFLEGGELFITGRAKDLIIRAGRNIYPYDLEQAVAELPGVRKGGVAVFGSPDPRSGVERLVVLAETRERETARRTELRRRIEEITQDLVQVLADDVVLAPPRTVLKTSSGKIRRSACRELYERGRLGRAAPLWLQLLRSAGASVAPLATRALRSIGARLYAAWAWLVFGVFALLTWLGVMLLPGTAVHRKVLSGCVRAALFCAGIPLRVTGREHLPHAEPCIIAANHASYLDAMVLAALLPDGFGFVAKRELARNWFVDVFLRRLGTFYVERFNAHSAARDMKRLTRAAHSGQPLVFFPEGTFTRAPGLRPFRMGAFMAAAQAALPVMPAVLRGTRQVLRSGSWLPSRGRIEVQFLPPVRPNGANWSAAVALRDQVRAAILEHYDEPDLT